MNITKKEKEELIHTGCINDKILAESFDGELLRAIKLASNKTSQTVSTIFKNALILWLSKNKFLPSFKTAYEIKNES